MEIFLISIISYMIGNVSPSYILAKKYKKIDIRNVESGNAGTTNALRVMGKKAALIVFLVDLFKGVFTTFIVRYFFSMDYAIISGICVVLGHIYPATLGFRGGKGVATMFGVLFCLFFKETAICAIFGLILLYVKRYVSLAALLTLFSISLVILVIGYPIKYAVEVFAIFLVIAYKHKENIKRLINHNERKLGEKKE